LYIVLNELTMIRAIIAVVKGSSFIIKYISIVIKINTAIIVLPYISFNNVSTVFSDRDE